MTVKRAPASHSADESLSQRGIPASDGGILTVPRNYMGNSGSSLLRGQIIAFASWVTDAIDEKAPASEIAALAP